MTITLARNKIIAKNESPQLNSAFTYTAQLLVHNKISEIMVIETNYLIHSYFLKELKEAPKYAYCHLSTVNVTFFPLRFSLSCFSFCVPIKVKL